MSEERLKEIKESIYLQSEVMKSIGMKIDSKSVLQEEIDMYNEILRLKSENTCLEAFINGFKNGIKLPQGAKAIKINHVCDVTRILVQYETWLKEEKDTVYRDCGHHQQICTECWNKLQEIKERITNEKEKI